MKTLDKKLFIILKYLILTIPLIITLINLFNAYFISNSFTRVIEKQENYEVWTEQNEGIETFEGDNMLWFWNEYTMYGNFDFHTQFRTSMNLFYQYLPKINKRISNTNIKTDPITLTMATIADNNWINNSSNYETYNQMPIGQLCHYLYYFIIIELIWAILYLFRWFIQFGYGLFEKERKL